MALRILHAIHDFLPRHAAGSEIYAFRLCRELAGRHHVHVLAAEYDPGRRHGSLNWRVHEGLPVIELVNNWEGTFADSWLSARIGSQLGRVLRATQPDVVHIHSLLNLSLDLPALARTQGCAVAATLHDHSLVCPAGGQRLHLVERTVCHEIDAARCAACFPHSPFHAQLAVGTASAAAGRGRLVVGRAAKWLARRMPAAAGVFRRHVLAHAPALDVDDIERRLAHVQTVFNAVQLFVAPSRAIADAHARLGLDQSKLVVSDYGFARQASPSAARARREPSAGSRPPLRFGFVGTLVSHKGPHVLLEAARRLPAGTFDIDVWGSPDTFPEYTARLQALARDLPVRFCGAFDNAHSGEVYEHMDALVVPSLWPENSPLVIHEAFMAGVPVVAARIGGIPELVHDGVNGMLYDPASPDSLAAALLELIKSPERLARMALHTPAVKTIEQDARDWEERYELLIEQAGRARFGEPS